MESNTGVAALVSALESQYLANEISLNALVHRCEALLDETRSALPPDTHKRAMNCVYILEEINALVLDEGRSMRDEERVRVKAELETLTSLATSA